MLLGRLNGVRHEHRDRQRANAAGHGRIGAGKFLHGIGIDIANKTLSVRSAILADIDHRSSRLYEVTREKSGLSDRAYQDVRLAAFSG